MSGAMTALERIAATAVSSPLLSRFVGRLAGLRLPRPLLVALIPAYVLAYGARPGHAALAVDAYPSFSAFFTRRLRDGARPIDATAGAVVAPSDSRLVSIGRVPDDGRLEPVKGQGYTIAELLGSTGEAEAFRGGSQATLYL